MTSRFLRTLVGAIASGFLFVLPLAAQAEWPQFHGPARDNLSPDKGLLKKWPAGGPKLVVTCTGLGYGYSSPAISGGMIYITGMTGSKELSLQAWTLAGKQQWKIVAGPAFPGSWSGSRSTPTVVDGRIYLLTGLGVVGCFDAKTGKKIWTFSFRDKFKSRVPSWGFAESVLVDGNLVICTPGVRGAAMAALNKKTGKLVWKSKGLRDMASYAAPVVFKAGKVRQVATMTANGAIGVDIKSGRLLWSFPHFTSHKVHANPLVFTGGLLFGSSGYGAGSFLLELPSKGKAGAVKLKWRNYNLDNKHHGLVLVGGYLYGGSDTGIKKGSREGKRTPRSLVCLDLKTGKVKYAQPMREQISITFADGMLYCLGEKKGTVVLAKASPKAFSPAGFFTAPKGGTGPYWAHPVVIGGRLYIRHADKLFIYNVKG